MFKITLRSKIKQICSPDVATTIIIVIITAKARLLEITGGEQPGRKCSHETGSQVTSDYFFSVFSFSAGHDKETEAEKAFIDARRYLKNTHSHTWRSHNSVCEETPVYAPSPLHTHTHILCFFSMSLKRMSARCPKQRVGRYEKERTEKDKDGQRCLISEELLS